MTDGPRRLELRSVVIAVISGKGRPGVIVHCTDDFAVVACGTHTAPDEKSDPGDHVPVPENSIFGRALCVEGTTYFYARDVKGVAWSRIKPRHGTCTPQLFAKLRQLAVKVVKAFVHEEPRADDPADPARGERG